MSRWANSVGIVSHRGYSHPKEDEILARTGDRLSSSSTPNAIEPVSRTSHSPLRQPNSTGTAQLDSASEQGIRDRREKRHAYHGNGAKSESPRNWTRSSQTSGATRRTTSNHSKERHTRSSESDRSASGVVLFGVSRFPTYSRSQSGVATPIEETTIDGLPTSATNHMH